VKYHIEYLMLPAHTDMWIETEARVTTVKPLHTVKDAEKAVRLLLGNKWRGKIRISKVVVLARG